MIVCRRYDASNSCRSQSFNYNTTFYLTARSRGARSIFSCSEDRQCFTDKRGPIQQYKNFKAFQWILKECD